MTKSRIRSRGRQAGVVVAGAAGSWRPVEAEFIGVSGFYEQASVLICGVVHLCRRPDSRDGPSYAPMLDLSLASGDRTVIRHFHFKLQTAKTENTVNLTQTASDQILTPCIL